MAEENDNQRRNSRPRTGSADLRERQDRTEKRPSRPSRPRTPRKPVTKKQREKHTFSFKLFGKWDPVEVTDPSLRGYVNVDSKLLPRSEGRVDGAFHKTRVHIVERLALKLMVSGHTGKKHKITSGKFAGNYTNVLGSVERALDLVEQREKKNPLEVLLKAIENSAVREEVISYQLGSIIAREAVVTSPQRRIDKTLRYIAQAAYRKSFHNKKTLAECIAEEIIAASKNSQDSFAIKEKERLEREASGAR